MEHMGIVCGYTLQEANSHPFRKGTLEDDFHWVFLFPKVEYVGFLEGSLYSDSIVFLLKIVEMISSLGFIYE